ncbi:plasmid recombination protein (plasmid) [Lactobacillus sp. ESL0731]|uniref:plasmid recombination protein n=1 Tax=Lactobacillus sp. ESL0731 TaxID=2983221 RepID=UPI0023F782AD|nr:plasmid recombination protein [Lactobacillus sp. ESL0731]WEV63201.1 plasmid recombination protein [Lactobacillus sp. ESL0731]
MNQKMTISFAKGKASETSIRHNNRSLDIEHFDFDKKGHTHIQREFTELNQVLVHRDIKDVYHEQFDPAIELYNAKQKRADRKIKNYYQQVLHSKNQQTQREFIVQVGNQQDYLNKDRANSKNWRAAKMILTEFEQEFEKDNPNFIVYNAVIHMDEPGSPHLHLNVVPVAHLPHAKRGLTIKPSFDKALREEGYQNDPKDSRALFSNFQHHETEQLSKIALRFGIEREAGFTNRLKNVHEYKQAMRRVDQAQEIAKTQQQENAEVQVKLTDQELKAEQLSQKVNEKQQNLANLDAQSVLNSKADKSYISNLKRLERVNKGQNADYYLPTKTFGILDKPLAQKRIAKLIRQADLPQNLVQIIQQNKQLLTENAQLKAQNQQLTTQNKTAELNGYSEGHTFGVEEGRREEQQRVHKNAGKPYQEKIKKLQEEIKQDEKIIMQSVENDRKQESKRIDLNAKIYDLQQKLTTGSEPYQQQIHDLQTELTEKQQENQVQAKQLKQQDQLIAEQKQALTARNRLIQQQQKQITKLDQFAKNLVVAVKDCKPLIKNVWDQVTKQVGQHFQKDLEPALKYFARYWDKEDVKKLNPEPSQEELQAAYFRQRAQRERSRGLER